MRPAERLEVISNFAQETADQLGLFVVDVKFGQEGKKRTLEVTIFRVDQAVSLSNCEEFSRLLETNLDRQAEGGDPLVDGAYSLIVQSPGIDRVLKTEREFRVFAGQTVQLQTKEKIADLGVKFTGILISVTADEVKLTHAKALAKASTKASAKAVNDLTTAPEIAKADMTLKRNLVSEIRLFAPDLQPKNK
jgi:ribosome maturation factor RimP